MKAAFLLLHLDGDGLFHCLILSILRSGHCKCILALLGILCKCDLSCLAGLHFAHEFLVLRVLVLGLDSHASHSLSKGSILGRRITKPSININIALILVKISSTQTFKSLL